MTFGLRILGCTTVGDTPAPERPAEHAPAPVPARAVEISVGDGTTCERRDDGTVGCRGAFVLEVPDLHGALEVTDLAVCARADGAVRCVRPGVDRRTPTAFVEVALGAGAKHGRDAQGGVWAFVGEVEAEADLVPVPLPGPAARIVADGQRACAVLVNRGLWCWDPYMALTRPPAPAAVAAGVADVDASWGRVCWIDAAGVACWGDGPQVRIPELAAPSDVAVGRAHGCALVDGAPWCWTDGAPTRVDAGPFVQIDAGAEHTCGLGADGAVACWGRPSPG